MTTNDALALFKVGECRRFECTTGGSNKFWEVQLESCISPAVSGHTSAYKVSVKYGKIGTNGSVESHDFVDLSSARRHITSKISEKINKKGYVLVGVNTAKVHFVDPPVPVPEKLIAQGEWDVL